MQKKNTLNILTSTVGRVILLAIIILFIVNIFRSIWKNHQITKQIDNLEQDISALENEQLNLNNRILYYQTNTYKELEARQHLNYKKKDEKVMILVKKEPTQNSDSTVKNIDSEDSKDNMTNWQKWFKYIFG